MREKAEPRGIISTVLMTSIGSAIGGLLWIGRPRLALVVLLAHLPLIGAVMWQGAPPLPSLPLISFMLLWLSSIALALLLRRRSYPRGWSSRWYWAFLLGQSSSLVVALVCRSLLLQPFSIPSMSTAPGIVVGDYIAVSKWRYGYSRYSFPFEIFPFEGRILAAQPRRGELVVFRHPSQPQVDYLKRLIGLPGDRVQMIDGVLHINDEPVSRQQAGELDDPRLTGADRAARVFRETLPGGAAYDTLDIAPDSIGDNTDVFQVPAGHFFMMGDNRDNSADSRFFGFVPFDNLIGRAERIFWNSAGTEYRSRRILVPARAGR